MALEEAVKNVSYIAESAIGQYIMVAAGTIPRGCVIAGVGARPLGVCQNKPMASGQAAAIAIFGIVKVAAGAAVPLGSPVGSDAAGKAIVVAAGPLALGTAITAATALDQVIEVQVA